VVQASSFFQVINALNNADGRNCSKLIEAEKRFSHLSDTSMANDTRQPVINVQYGNFEGKKLPTFIQAVIRPSHQCGLIKSNHIISNVFCGTDDWFNIQLGSIDLSKWNDKIFKFIQLGCVQVEYNVAIHRHNFAEPEPNAVTVCTSFKDTKGNGLGFGQEKIYEKAES